MENMELYNKLRVVPDTAKRTIGAGRLKGKTDINPMWRIRALTETFGPCGIGWRYEITREWLEHGAGDEVSAFVDINLYVKTDAWSVAIPGTGGSAFVASESNGLHTSDECYKMALTDAISVACKALGVGADVYWDKDSTKYTRPESPKAEPIKCESCGFDIEPVTSGGKTYTPAEIAENTKKTFGKSLCWECAKLAKAHGGEK